MHAVSLWWGLGGQATVTSDLSGNGPLQGVTASRKQGHPGGPEPLPRAEGMPGYFLQSSIRHRGGLDTPRPAVVTTAAPPAGPWPRAPASRAGSRQEPRLLPALALSWMAAPGQRGTPRLGVHVRSSRVPSREATPQPRNALAPGTRPPWQDPVTLEPHGPRQDGPLWGPPALLSSPPPPVGAAPSSPEDRPPPRALQR